MLNIIKKHIKLLIFTLLYLIPFSIYFVSTGKGEFIWYTLIVLFLFLLIFLTLPKTKFGGGILWSLSGWALLHLAGGGIKVGSGVLYGLVLIPVYDGGGEMLFLKYDQVVHAFGFAICAYMVFHFLKMHIPNPYKLSIYLISILGGIGLGAINEIVEFIATILFPNNGVGGYVNNSLDLIFNAVGAILIMFFVYLKNNNIEQK